MNSILIISLICFQLIHIIVALKGTAQLTAFESYARCCKNNSNYDAQISDCSTSNAW